MGFAFATAVDNRERNSRWEGEDGSDLSGSDKKIRAQFMIIQRLNSLIRRLGWERKQFTA